MAVVYQLTLPLTQAPKLLSELLPLVLTHLSHKDLQAASLVCREWVAPAQSLIHHLLVISTYGQLTCAERLYTSYPHLRPLVKQFELRLEQEFQNPDTIPIGFERIQHLLPLLTSVRQLWIANLFDLSAEKRAALAPLSQLEELTLETSNLQNVDRYEIEDFDQILKHWSQLHHLTLRCFLFAEHDGVPSARCPASFSDLYLFGSLFTDEELEWLLSGSNSLKTFEYVQLKLKGTEELDFSRMLAGFGAMFGIPVPPQAPSAPKVIPKATPEGLVALIAARGGQLRKLYLGVEKLKPDDIAQILSATPNLEILGIPLISVDDTTTSSAPSTLHTFQLYLLPESDVVTEEALKLAVGRLSSMKLDFVDEIELSNIYGGLAYEGLEKEICKIGEEKGIEVWQRDRFFHHWYPAKRLSPAPEEST
ncbi:hypothetical protein BCR35DRAFT_333935 [Leucosporidium creatinivorum]|uniref:F-box domain-containing protein n=1 Tax=Leucosporidium creatinivorum TaxID=106004 RepID=A0A1Y2EMG4_9BASI|nr:hypothetical protein BCR35DRAFT_333935 [Leucosporidium creatinivorum]